MKKVTLILAALILAVLSTYGQETKAPAYRIEGNEIVKIEQAPKQAKEPEKTGLTHTIKGTIYPVYKSAKGSYFIIRTSKKTGTQYKQYLKVE